MMRYFYCGYCGELFREDAASEKVREDGRTYYACPNCGDLEIYDADSCKICGEPIRPGADYCRECRYDVKKIWERAVCEVMSIRVEHREIQNADYTKCEEALVEFLDDNGVI